MAKNYAVVRTDRMEGTGDRNSLISVKYINGSEEEAAIENGNVLKRGALAAIDATNGVYEREIFVGTAVAAGDNLDDVVLVCTPEVCYDERDRELDDFINPAGKAARAYHLRKGDIFSVTKPALDGSASPAVGNLVELKAGTKLNVVASATNGSTQVGKIIAIDVVGKYTYYVILVG